MDTEETVCGNFIQQLMFNKIDTRYVKFHEGQWIECDKFGVCGKKTHSILLTDSMGDMICFEFICFEYKNNKLFIKQKTLDILDSKIELEKSSPYSQIYNRNLTSACVTNDYEKFVFRYSGSKFISKIFYSVLKNRINSAVARVSIKKYGDDSTAALQLAEDNIRVNKLILPPKPIYCAMNWQDPQQLDLSIENQCVVYSFNGAQEYYLALGYNPSSTHSIIYLHHDKNGLCLHGMNINSVCNFNDEAKIISDFNINSNMYLCLNQTRAHLSFKEDRTENLVTDLIEIPRSLNIKVGYVEGFAKMIFCSYCLFF